MTPDEIQSLREQGLSAEEIIEKQQERHGRFDLKTEYSKEKWRKRKEKKYGQYVTPLSPTLENVLLFNQARNPSGILSLRIDTLTQLLNLASIRPGGRYLVVDDTSGLLTASILLRMGGHGRILLLTETDSPPAWAVLNAMNFPSEMISGKEGIIKWLNWMEAEEDWVPVEKTSGAVDDDDGEDLEEKETVVTPEVRVPGTKGKATPADKKLWKERQKMRKFENQRAELNAIREELHRGNWDG